MVTITYGPEAGPPPAGSQHARPVSVTITDQARIRQVSGLLDGLSPASPGEEWSCPAFTDGVVNLAFKNSASGRTLAVAQFNMSGCPDVDLTIAGAQQGLVIPSDTFPPHILQLAGIRAATGS
ncbi:MAG: hypothetical protein M3Z75_12130 [Actinomycetota bacterium]|nr:hypothetical protein [Actinomycetota bacterium]